MNSTNSDIRFIECEKYNYDKYITMKNCNKTIISKKFNGTNFFLVHVANYGPYLYYDIYYNNKKYDNVVSDNKLTRIIFKWISKDNYDLRRELEKENNELYKILSEYINYPDNKLRALCGHICVDYYREMLKKNMKHLSDNIHIRSNKKLKDILVDFIVELWD